MGKRYRMRHSRGFHLRSQRLAKSHTHARSLARNFVRGRRSGVYDLLSWINVYDMKMSRNLLWLIKKAEA